MNSNKVIGTSINIPVKDKVAKVSPILFSSLSLLQRGVKQNWDGLIILTGAVGTGKSTLATTIAGIWEKLFGRELTIDNFTWRSEGIVDFTDRKDNETYSIVFDEAIQGGTGKDSLTKAGNALKVTLVTKRRKKHLYIVLVDEVQELSKKIISRASFLIDCRTILRNGEKERGYFKIYNKDELTTIYWLLKKYLIQNISEYRGKSKPFFRFWDNKDIFVSDEEYENKKIEETNQQMEDNKLTINDKEKKILSYLIYTPLRNIDIAKKVSCDASYVSRVKGKFKNDDLLFDIK